MTWADVSMFLRALVVGQAFVLVPALVLALVSTGLSTILLSLSRAFGFPEQMSALQAAGFYTGGALAFAITVAFLFSVRGAG